jgi:sugar phosphate permease
MKWAIWTLSAIFFFYEFFIRVAPSVMVPELMATFGLTATAIGSLSGFYYYIYAPMQIPVGVLTDRYGARKLLAIAAFIVGIGTLLFSLSEHFFLAALGRLLMGGGSAFGFVGMVYVCSHWFPAKKRGILVGFANAIGMVGAIMGQGPLRLGIDSMGWRATMGWLGGFGLLLALVIYLFVRNDPPEMKKHDEKVKDPTHTLLHSLAIVMRNKYSWLSSLVSLFFYITTTGFAALWGIPFLNTTYGLSIEVAGFIISMIFVGWAIGGPLIGHYSDRIKQKKTPIVLASLFGGLTLLIVVLMPNLPVWSLYALLLLVGCFSSGQLLTYGYTIDVNPEFAKGTAIAFTNFITFVGGALIQPFIGYLLDFFWIGELSKGIRVYSSYEYRLAILCFPACFFLATLLALTLKNPTKIKKACA